MSKKIVLINFILSIMFSTQYNIDIEESNIFWIGRKITGEHYGTINIKTGYINIDNNSITDGEIVIDMESILVLDMSEKYNKKLESHLKSVDFFDVDNFPIASFKIKNMYNFFMIDNIIFEGDLNIKDIEVDISVPAAISINNSIAESIGVININRTLFGITYGSGSFFEDLADKAIDDQFTLKFKIVAKRDEN